MMRTVQILKAPPYWVLALTILVFLVSCGPAQEELDATATKSAENVLATQTAEEPRATATLPSPTQTLIPTPSPTPLPYAETVTIPDCVPGETQEELPFHEAVQALELALLELDSYSYRVIYQYKSGVDYAPDELALEIFGEHSGLINEENPSYGFPSQRYNHSHTVMTDLHSMAQDEYILTDKGLWLRASDGSGWIAIESGRSSEIFNLAELLAPPFINIMATGSGGLNPGIWSQIPVMSIQETINGLDTTHRCWKPEPYGYEEEPYSLIDGYLIHWDSLYTFLGDTEVHLWTVDDDTQLIRLVVKGKHIAERYFDYGELTHDPPNDFLLWVELSDINQSIEINPPSSDEIVFTILDIPTGQQLANDAPYNQLPLPPDAESVGESENERLEEIYTSIEDSGPTLENVEPFRPREFISREYEFKNPLMDEKFGASWYLIPQERSPIHETDMGITSLMTYYVTEMDNLGWSLEDTIIQLGTRKYFLFFTRDNIIFPIILEDGREKASRISALLPPNEALAEALLSGWVTYNESNSDLLNNQVNAIAFDKKGQAWIGSGTTGGWSVSYADGTSSEIPQKDGGVSVFDGETWITYTEASSGMVSNNVDSIAIDNEGRAWIGTPDGLNLFDGETWTTYTEEDNGLAGFQEIVIDDDGSVWLSNGGGISVFDGTNWKSYNHLYHIRALDIDEEEQPWIGTIGGGVYSLDGDTWTEHVIPVSEPGHWNEYDIDDLSFDSQGRLWVVSDSAGLRALDGEAWESYDFEDTGLKISSVEDLVIDQQDRVWLVTFGGGVYMLDTKGKWTEYTPYGIGISIYAPDVVTVDQQGRIWIGSQEGVAVFTPPTP